MQLKKRLFLFVSIFFIVNYSFSQNLQKSLTADQVIQRAIDSSGGNKIFDSIRNFEIISQIIMPNNDTLSFSTKKMDFDKYFISSLSLGYFNTTRIYNKGKGVRITDQNAENISDPLALEALQLQSFICPEYGYKKLGYTFKRQDDQKFENFDCFTILVSSPLGRVTINYYDKKTGKLIMIIYPSLSKSVFIDFYKEKGITYPSKVLMVDSLDAITSSTLISFHYNEHLDSNWFNVPVAGVYKAPETYKTGTFKYLNNNEDARITRDKTTHTEISGGVKKEYKIEWTTDIDYLLYRLKNASVPPVNENIEYIKVRIILWTQDKYYCQYLGSGNIGGTCVFQKLD